MIYMPLMYCGCMFCSGQYLNKSSVSLGSLCINTLNLCCLQGKEHLLIVTYTGITVSRASLAVYSTLSGAYRICFNLFLFFHHFLSVFICKLFSMIIFFLFLLLQTQKHFQQRKKVHLHRQQRKVEF